MDPSGPSTAIVRIEIDGAQATPEQLRWPNVTYGHFTAMQVRGGSVRGLALHLERLRAANRELFDADLDGDRVRDHIRHALGDDIDDASVRTYVFVAEGATEPAVMITVRPPGGMPSTPRALKSVPYQRPVPHIKHLGGYGQAYFRHVAEREGFDDALLAGPGGEIAECSIANIGFFDGASVIWPDTPALAGITMQLVEPKLPSRRDTVRLADLPTFRGAFVTNSRGIAPVGRVDDLSLPVDERLMDTVAQVYASIPWDPI